MSAADDRYIETAIQDDEAKPRTVDELYENATRAVAAKIVKRLSDSLESGDPSVLKDGMHYSHGKWDPIFFADVKRHFMAMLPAGTKYGIEMLDASAQPNDVAAPSMWSFFGSSSLNLSSLDGGVYVYITRL